MATIQTARIKGNSQPSRPGKSELNLEFFQGHALAVRVALYEGQALASIANMASVRLMVKQSQDDAGDPLMSKTVVAADLTATTGAAWIAGTGQHAVFEFSDAECNIPAGEYWLVLTAMLLSGETINYGTGKAVCYADNSAATGNPPVNSDTYPTATEVAGLVAASSAYAIAVLNGFVGDEAAWLLSLKGDPGDPGNDGNNGNDGDSAYQIAVANGFVGNEAAWLASLKGEPGDPGIDGTDGASAYQIAVANGFVGNEAAWLLSLKGEKGDKGDDGDGSGAGISDPDVAYVRSDGDDSTGDGSPGAPFLTWQGAIDHASVFTAFDFGVGSFGDGDFSARAFSALTIALAGKGQHFTALGDLVNPGQTSRPLTVEIKGGLTLDDCLCGTAGYGTSGADLTIIAAAPTVIDSIDSSGGAGNNGGGVGPGGNGGNGGVIALKGPITVTGAITFAGGAAGGDSGYGPGSPGAIGSLTTDQGRGKILQVVQATKTDTASTTGTTYGTLLSCSITPTKATSKILVMVAANISSSSAGNPMRCQLLRDSTPTLAGDAASSRSQVFAGRYIDATNNSYGFEPLSFQYLDSPGTTSPVTYNVQFSSAGADTIYINRSNGDADASYVLRGASTLILLEVDDP